ncbi:MAG: ATP-binding protein [Candidatus Omnitrophica bacterium]|nr:ATP-binding protein [Candidatus Omnitrophota bacterium]MDD5552977.1 ATP-binding protein [Candidatus Omnitrophota bacterium]
MLIYLATAVLSVLVALLLVNLAKLSSHSRRAVNLKRKVPDADILADEPLKRTIFEAIDNIVESHDSRHEAAMRISDVFYKELQKRISNTAQELNKKYETAIKEQKLNEEIAWKKYNKILSDKKKTEAVIRSIAEGLVVIDADGKVIMMNPAAEKLLGISRKEKIGKSLMEDLKEEQLVSLVKSDEEREEREITVVSQRDETKKILRASSAVIENENGQTVGMVSVLSDITKQKELDQLKSNFVASVSHELRTPLVAIDKSLSLILGEDTSGINENQRQLLDIAERNLKRLGFLVNDLLDLSKLEAGRTQFKPEPVSIAGVITEAVESLKAWAGTKSIAIEMRIPPGLPEPSIDTDRILQVLNNLIGNAVKFTPNDGKIFIEANINQAKEMEVSVADTGIGIPPEVIGKVFDKFYQVSDRPTTDISGTGIGLSIAKEIVNRHGGKIWAESDGHHGSKFVFTLPLK